MAEDSDLEKTEPASPKRIEQARDDGDVPRSRELATCTLLLAAGSGLWFFGPSLIERMNQGLVAGLGFSRAEAFDPNLLFDQIGSNVVAVAVAFAPIALLLIVVALASPLLIGGWLFSGKALQPKFGKLNPLKGLGNMVSVNALVELGKAIGKTLLVGIVAWIVLNHQINTMLGMSVEPAQEGVSHLGSLLITGFISIVSALVLIALIDAPYQMWNYAKKLKMTRQEVRQESKESDGDPQIKAKIRAQQREMAQRRMMSEVPTADVVVTNPTHYAVALKYADGGNRAPIVVAKGADEVAAKIREIAAANNVPTLEAPALARALNRHTELGDEIPQALYTAVAEILAYVFQLRSYKKTGGVRPEMPHKLDVPPELDPNNPASNTVQDSVSTHTVAEANA